MSKLHVAAYSMLLLTLIAGWALSYALFSEVKLPSQRWREVLTRGKLAEHFADPSAITRSQVRKVLGPPDQRNLPKEYDLWLDSHTVRRHLNVTYDTGADGMALDPIVRHIVYQSFIVLADRKFTFDVLVVDVGAAPAD